MVIKFDSKALISKYHVKVWERRDPYPLDSQLEQTATCDDPAHTRTVLNLLSLAL